MTTVETIGTLETERLRIVPLSKEEFLTTRAALDPQDELCGAMDELLERAAADPEDAFSWYTNRMLVRRADGVCVGSAAFMSNPHTDRERLVEIGYGIDEPYRGCGYATEAVAAMTEAALRVRAADGVIAGVELGNRASERVLEKCGFRRTDRSKTLGLEIYKKFRADDPRQKQPALFFRWAQHLARKSKDE